MKVEKYFEVMEKISPYFVPDFGTPSPEGVRELVQQVLDTSTD